MAFYRPSFLSPESIAISGSQNNDFSCQVNVSGETVTNYRLKILTMANVSVYDTGTVSATPVKYDKERLYHTVPSGTLTNGTQYKWTITTNPSAATPVYSKETPFWAYSTPTVVFNATPTTITTKSYNFVCTYSQAQSVPFSKWKMVWYDASNTIIEDTGWNYTGYISYTFDGFADGATYKVKCFVENQVGTIIDTGFYIFLVDYASPNIDIVPETELLPEVGAVNITWGRAVQITGSSTGITSYVPDFMKAGNYGISLDSATPTVSFDGLNVPPAFTAKFVWQKPTVFAGGTIFALDDSKYILSYNTSTSQFSLSGTSFPSTLTSPAVTLNSNPYLIACLASKAYIIQNNTLVTSVEI